MLRRPPRSPLFPYPAPSRSRGRSTLIIAHRLSTVRRADRVVVLDRGRVVESGRHETLLGENGLYARLYSTQGATAGGGPLDRKSTRLNSSHANISYAVFCLK